MAGKMLSPEPTIDPTASARGCRLGAYTEVGARTILLEVTMDDYSYVVNDAQITYTTIGKFCSIAAMTRINPGNHPMQRTSQAHFTYRAAYTIVAGNPARPIRQRFTESVAARLTELAWWDWDHETLRSALPDFRKRDVEGFLDKYESAGASVRPSNRSAAS